MGDILRHPTNRTIKIKIKNDSFFLLSCSSNLTMLPEIEDIAHKYLKCSSPMMDGEIGNPFVTVKTPEYYFGLVIRGHHPSFINSDNIWFVMSDRYTIYGNNAFKKYTKYCFKWFPCETAYFVDMACFNDADRKKYMLQVMNWYFTHTCNDLLLYVMFGDNSLMKNSKETVEHFNFDVDGDDYILNGLHESLVTKIMYMSDSSAYLDRLEVVLFEATAGRDHSDIIEAINTLIRTLEYVNRYGYAKTFFKIINLIKKYGTQDCAKHFIRSLRYTRHEN